MVFLTIPIGMYFIRIRKLPFCNIKKFFIIIPIHSKVNIIIPWNKSFVPDCS